MNSTCKRSSEQPIISKDAKFCPMFPHKTVNMKISTDQHVLNHKKYKG